LRQAKQQEVVMRHLATDKLKINFSIDSTEAAADPNGETLLRGLSPDPNESNVCGVKSTLDFCLENSYLIRQSSKILTPSRSRHWVAFGGTPLICDLAVEYPFH
jgi:hypothetical protein